MDRHTKQCIVAKLNILKRADTRLSEKHYTLFPVATEDEVNAFEQQYHIQLPESFRWFITCIGNGGAGPGLRLHTLQDIQYELDIRGGVGKDLAVWYLSRPFICPSSIEASIRAPIHNMLGMLPISHIGCGLDYYLCVAGKEYGNIWFWGHGWYPFPALDNRPQELSWREEEEFESPEAYDEYEDRMNEEEDRIRTQWHTHLLSHHNTYRVTFLDWYLVWLDETFQWVRSGRSTTDRFSFGITH